MADLVTSEQLRAARAMLRMEQKALSEASGVSLASVKRLEGASGSLTAHRPTITALQRALEAAGVEFTNGEGAGVKLRKPNTRSIPLDDLNAANDE